MQIPQRTFFHSRPSSQFKSADEFLAHCLDREKKREEKKKEMQHVARHQQIQQMKTYTTFALYRDMFQHRLALL